MSPAGRQYSRSVAKAGVGLVARLIEFDTGGQLGTVLVNEDHVVMVQRHVDQPDATVVNFATGKTLTIRQPYEKVRSQLQS